MKTSIIALSLLAATATAGEAPVSTPEFAGYFSAGSELLFIVVDPTANEKSSLLKLDESWRGYRLISFDAQAETLVVAKDAEKFELKLRASKVVHGDLLPKLLRGSFSTIDGKVVYSADAEIDFSPKYTVRSAGGPMIYNSTDGTIRGDLVVDHISSPMLVIAKEGVMRLKEGGKTTASKMLVQKKPNKALEPTTTSVTSPAAQEPRQP